PLQWGVFFITVDFPLSYPSRTPEVRFTTRIYLPNVTGSNSIPTTTISISRFWVPQLSLVRSKVYPSLTLKVLNGIGKPLRGPQIEHPIAREIAEVCKKDQTNYEATPREWARKYAV
ncbi:ubiquitin-conjugating enzyme/RWD-like protein, partial [Triangularia setosa]